MIARITGVRTETKGKTTLVATTYEDTQEVEYTVETKKIEEALKALGGKEDGLLEIDIDADDDKVYLLLMLLAGCELGSNAKLPCKEVKGQILELKGSDNLHIETEYDDRYVVCHCDARIIQRYHEIFRCNNLTEIPGFYYHQTGEAYIGYQIK